MLAPELRRGGGEGREPSKAPERAPEQPGVEAEFTQSGLQLACSWREDRAQPGSGFGHGPGVGGFCGLDRPAGALEGLKAGFSATASSF
ncbi:MAG: hypothetical protein DLM67_25190 [Candidatus Nephthysia bennettiae]|nr:MAG: hypothetical protein DLM67_25190 [Candidatus Dormibacteraeota bacterium]